MEPNVPDTTISYLGNGMNLGYTYTLNGHVYPVEIHATPFSLVLYPIKFAVFK